MGIKNRIFYSTDTVYPQGCHCTKEKVDNFDYQVKYDGGATEYLTLTKCDFTPEKNIQYPKPKTKSKRH